MRPPLFLYKTKVFVRDVFILIFYALISSQAQAQESLEGAWIGYIVDFTQIKNESLPKVYAMKMLIKRQSPNIYKGIISKYWDAYYNTVSSVVGVYDKKKNAINLSEDRFIEMVSDKENMNCKMTSVLYIAQENNETVLNGRYYSLDKNINHHCPMGTLYLERPQKDSSAFEYLSQLLQRKTPNEKKKEEPIAVDPFYFPNIVVSSNVYENLQNRINYDIHRLSKSQKTISGRAIVWKKENLTLTLKPLHTSGDTINIFIDDVNLVKNATLNSHSTVSLQIDFKDLKKQGIKKHTHHLYIVPFSWGSRTLELEVELYDDKHKKVDSFVYKYTSISNLEIPLSIRLK